MKKYLNLTEDLSIYTNSLCGLARIVLSKYYFEIETDMYYQK